MDKAPDAFRTISEVADDLDIPQHVLRFWETRFAQIKPMKRGGGRRYYRPADVDLLRGIKHLLYGEGYTIKGVQRILREEGVKHVQSVWQADIEAASEPEEVDKPSATRESVPETRREPVIAAPAAPARRTAVASFVDEDEDDGPEPAPEQTAPASAMTPALAGTGRRQLESALVELRECRRLLQSAIEAAH